MAVKEWKSYAVGEHGWIEVLDFTGDSWHWVQGEIVRLIPGDEECAWALIRTIAGTDLCRLGGFPPPAEEVSPPATFRAAPARKG